MKARIRSPLRIVSRGSISSRRTIASPRPRSTTTLPYSTRLTMPLTISPIRSLYSSYCRSRSASRTFCTITCLADCAAMRPYSSGGSVSAITSPICAAGLWRRASSRPIWLAGFSTVSTTSMWRDNRSSPFFGSISACTSVALLALRFALAFACFALLGLGAVERFGHQRVGEDELGFRHVGDREQEFGRRVGLGVIGADAGGVALRAEEHSAKPLAAVHRRR